MLDTRSTEKGILIPRRTSDQRDSIDMPAQGLLVYVVTDSSFYYYDAPKSVKLGADNLGDHTATQSLNLDVNYLSGDL